MTESNSSPVLTWFIVLVVVFSVVFTWKALNQTTDSNSISQPVISQTAESSAPPAPAISSGEVAVNIQTKEDA